MRDEQPAALLSTLIVPPIAEALMVSSMAGLFTVMAALVTGSASRRTQAARLGLLLVPITLLPALAVTAFLKHQADTLGGATVLPALPAPAAAR